MTEYIVIEEENIGNLIKKVNGLIRFGWKLQGGVSTYCWVDTEHDKSNSYYCQALTLTTTD